MVQKSLQSIIRVMANQITLSRHDNEHVQKVIVAVDEEFKKSHGQAVNLNKIIANESFRRLAENNRYVATRPDDRVVVRNFIVDVIRNTDRLKKMFEMRPNDTENIYRKNVYNIKSDRDLKKFIYEHPEGIEIGDEFLFYTYRKVVQDLDRLFKENTFRKLHFQKPLGESNAKYMIFPKKEEESFDIVPFPDKHEAVFDYTRYMAVCSKIKNADNVGDNLDNTKKANFKESQSDPNYKLPGYRELKEEWLKLNNKK